MGTLFIIGSREAETALQLARKLKGRGERVILVFRGEGIRLSDRPGFDDETAFADEVYILEDGGRSGRARPAKAIGPHELVELMEACGRVVSWT
jgi:hypothetical protein